MKKYLYCLLDIPLLAASFATLAIYNKSGPTLRIASWEEYIDEGGPNSYVPNSKSIVEEFEDWYYEQTGEKIVVEYIPLQDNETMYNQIKLGEKFDILCPSEYLIMKLIEEDRLQPFPYSFFDPTIETNYYIQNISPYIHNLFSTSDINGLTWADYSAGYMWGTTGFAYDSAKVNPEDVKSWNVYDKNYKISAKDNVRDSYFAGIGMCYEQELLEIKNRLEIDSTYTLTEYRKDLNSIMNNVSDEAVNKVEKRLKKMRSSDSFWGFEAESKSEVISGEIEISYQWSGDAVLIMNEAEKNGLKYKYCVPDASTNLWFDSWVIMKDAQITPATMFINFVSKPENVIRNMYYIGNTSCVGGDKVFEFVKEIYETTESENTVPYDLSYFFGGTNIIQADKEQLERQLFAQYPTQDVMDRSVIMQYFDEKATEKTNNLWKNVKNAK